MTYSQISDSELLKLCGLGDRTAFSCLMEGNRKKLYYFFTIRCRGHAAEAEDLTQETLIRMWSALSRGTTVAAFSAWMYTIAKHVHTDWCKRQQASAQREAGPDVPIEELADPSPAADEVCAFTLSVEFILRQLDEALIPDPEDGEKRKKGYLRKLAFMYFYADRMTLFQIQSEIRVHARTLGLPEPTLTQLNNWLCRGDILALLVKHLVADHADSLAKQFLACVDALTLRESDRALVHLRWRDGMSLEEIAKRSGRKLSEVCQILKQTKQLLIPEVISRIRQNLHDARRR